MRFLAKLITKFFFVNTLSLGRANAGTELQETVAQ